MVAPAVEDADLDLWVGLAREAERLCAAAKEDEVERAVNEEENEVPQLREMKGEEMKDRDCYVVKAILQNKYKYGW